MFLFLVVGLLASAERPGTINDPFARARATPLPTREDFKALEPTQAARFRDERLNYYETNDGGQNWNGQAVMGEGGAGDQYAACRARCDRPGAATAECFAQCDRAYVQSQATNTNQIYRFAPRSDGQSGSTATGQVPQEGLRMPSSLPGPRESSVIEENGARNWPKVDEKRD